ncbi:hypothetical protein EVAR_20233_1 [Eumeta japonica]|uniref:Uncharacterized protein n=1 Tax=Eumeta variegata TaxID=151549 RepID=A0A4C1W9M6_EUMVA|nr:hypothetical protein EVAR_20233_1 [Eumeta japonica]
MEAASYIGSLQLGAFSAGCPSEVFGIISQYWFGRYRTPSVVGRMVSAAVTARELASRFFSAIAALRTGCTNIAACYSYICASGMNAYACTYGLHTLRRGHIVHTPAA